MEEILTRLVNVVEGLDKRLGNMEHEILNLRTEMSDLRTEVSELRTEVSDLRAEMSDMRTEMSDVRTEVSDLRAEMSDLRTEVSDLRHSNFIAIDTLGKEIGAMGDTQAVAMDKWNRSMDIMERVEFLLNDRETEVVAIDATIVDHENRINILEQKVS